MAAATLTLAAPRRAASFSEEPGAASARWLCVAAYVAIKLMDGSVSLLLKYLTMENHSEYKVFKALTVDIGALKLAHLLITAAIPYVVARPFLLCSMIAMLGCTFGLFVGVTLVHTYTELPLLPLWLRSTLYIHALLSVGVDAVADALARSMGVYLQPSKKFGSIICTLSLILQLVLPITWRAAPLLIVASLACLAVALSCLSAMRMGHSAAGLRLSTDVADAGHLPLGFALLFLAAVVIGDNGEELNDQIANLEIDKDLAGGKTGATLIKTGISLIASVTSASAFVVTYRRRFEQPDEKGQKESTSRESKLAVVAVVVWGTFQGARLAAVRAGALGQGWSVAALVLFDKMTGSFAEDACGQLQTLSLHEMALPAGAALLPITPHLAGSFAEVVDKLSKAFITKSLLDEHSWVSLHTSVLVALLTLAAISLHGALAFMLLQRSPSENWKAKED